MNKPSKDIEWGEAPKVKVPEPISSVDCLRVYIEVYLEYTGLDIEDVVLVKEQRDGHVKCYLEKKKRTFETLTYNKTLKG